ncbi:MAG: hypothetical protein HQL87_07840 [Magnetococcales bacterium]|nr:hypothetical protein [Magnetococcales bacterium]
MKGMPRSKVSHTEPCGALTDTTQQIYGVSLTMKQMGEALARLESQVAQINDKLSKLIDHEGRIERLEEDQDGCQASREKMWIELKAVKQTADQSLAAIQELQRAAAESRARMKDAIGWGVAILSGLGGVVYAVWQIAMGK